MFPIILERLRDGALTLAPVTILRPHLTSDNADALIAAAQHQSKRQVEQQVAALAPKPDARSIIRRLPDAKAAIDSEVPISAPAASHDTKAKQPPPPSSPRTLSTPLSSDRYLLRVTLSANAHAKLQRARDLMRHSLPNGDPAVIVEKALDLLVDDLERRRLANVKKPRASSGTDESADPSSRYVPAAVRRAVWARDAGRCAFVGRQGRCRETGHLELHHIDAFAFGGHATVENLELRCRAHNQYEGELLFGPRSTPAEPAERTRPGPSSLGHSRARTASAQGSRHARRTADLGPGTLDSGLKRDQGLGTRDRDLGSPKLFVVSCELRS